MKKATSMAFLTLVALGVMTLLFISTPVSAYTEGLISGIVISSYEYDPQEGRYPDAIVVGEDDTYEYVAVVSTGDTGTENDGYVRTMKVNKATGVWTASLIDYLEYDTSDGYSPSICQVGTGYYAIAYCDAGSSKQTIVTVSIDSTGNVGNAVIDTQQLTYDGIDGSSRCKILQVTGSTYAVVYTVSDGDGWIETVLITTSGAISSPLDTQEFDTADGYFPTAMMVDSNTILVAYEGTDTGADGYRDGWMVTYNITSMGAITNTPADTLEYASDIGTNPSLGHINGIYYLISFEGTGNDGFVNSFTCQDDGSLPAVFVDSIEYDIADGGFQTLFYIGLSNTASTQTWGITYQGTSGDGFVCTIWTDTSGTMSLTTRNDFFEYDIADSIWFAPAFFINGTYWGIAYEGTGNDGFLVTIMIDNEYDCTLSESIGYAYGTHTKTLGDTGYTVTATYTSTLKKFEVIGNATGTHQSFWWSSNGTWGVYANYTSYLSLNEDTGYATGTHTGTWSKSLNAWKVWANYTSDVRDFNTFTNCSGTRSHYWVVNRWWDWANVTGTTTSIHTTDTKNNVTGSVSTNLNATGWWVTSTHESTINQLANIINATGTHQKLWTGTTWNDWANYTGNTTSIHTNDTSIYVNGNLTYNLNGTGYWVTDNHSSRAYLASAPYYWNYSWLVQWQPQPVSGAWMVFVNSTQQNLNFVENYNNATVTHNYTWNVSDLYDPDPDSQYGHYYGNYTIWVNATGNVSGSCDSTNLTILRNIVNATGTNASAYDSTTGWTVWVNYTGNTTPITLFQNIINASGSHNYNLNGSGYTIWANYTGNTTAIHTTDTKNNVTGSVTTNLNATGWWVTSTHESILNQIANIVNATGTHQKVWTGTQWNDWANYTGNTTGLNLDENIINATGSHDYNLNSSGYWVWANYTGNTTPITLYENLFNASGTHEYNLNGSGYFVWANYTGASPIGNIEVTGYKANQTSVFSTNKVAFQNVTGLNLTIAGESVNSTYFLLWSLTTYASATADANFSFFLDNVSLGYTGRQIGTGKKELIVQAVHMHDAEMGNMSLCCRVNVQGGQTIYVQNSSLVVWNTYDNETLLPSNHTIETSQISTSATSYTNMTGTRFNITLNYPSRIFVLRSCEARITNANKLMYSTVAVDNVPLDSVGDTFEGTGWKSRSWFYVSGTLSAGTHEIVGKWHTETGTTVYARDIYISAISPIDLNNNVFSGNADMEHTSSTTSTTLTDTGLTVDITLTQKGHIYAFFNALLGWSSANKPGYFSININGTDYEVEQHQKSSPNKKACVAIATRTVAELEPGVYTVKARWATASGNTLSGANMSLFAFPSQAGTCPSCGSTDLTLYENPVNCTGTHDSSYDSILGWTVWANYTGNTTSIHTTDTKNNVTGSVSTNLNATGWWVTSTHESILNQIANIVNATGTHQKVWTGTQWNDWANYTGNTTGIHTIDTKNNVTGSVTTNLNSTGWWVTSTHESTINQLANIINATGTHQKLWTGTTWNDWANYTGNTTAINLLENIINATGTHTYNLNSTGYTVWANYTGNASVCNSTSLTLFQNIINATGTHASLYDPVLGWYVWANYTGNTTAINLNDIENNVTGSLTYNLNSTGYWVTSDHESTISQFQNIINATGSHTFLWTGTTWNVWANYTGNTTSLTLNEDIINSTGTHSYNLNSSGYTVWANYTSYLALLETIINATGTHIGGFNNSGGTWEVWANYTGNTTPITLFQNIINATGTHTYNLNDTGYYVWANYTGNGTGGGSTNLTIITDIVNATGTNESAYDSGTGWTVWVNYTGNTTALHKLENIGYATGTHNSNLNSTGWWVWANYTSDLDTFENIINATGTHDFNWDGSDWNVWANYTGNTTAIHITDIESNVTGSVNYNLNSTGWWLVSNHESIVELYENFISATGTHQKQWNGTRWNVWANVTGNASVNATLYIPIGDQNIYKNVLLFGMILSYPALLITRRKRKRNIYS